MKYYEQRNITRSENFSIDTLWQDENELTLIEALFEFDNIVLLGNPGIGKTTELVNAFDRLWATKNKTGFVPIYINLKYFRQTNTFESLIVFEDWQSLPGIIFILDGLDEIVDIQDFLSELEIFISKNSSLNAKYLISCRTNIYEKYLISISDFEVFFLKSLNYSQAKSILKNKHAIEIESLKLNKKQNDFLSSPFFLDLLAAYFTEKEYLPETDSEIWDLYVKKTIHEHRKKFAKKKITNAPELTKGLKKVAFVNELMHRNYINEEELNTIIGPEHIEFVENPFLVFNSTLENWSFEHRQIQEYFVAKSLLNKDFEYILNFIKVADVDAIHPSLFNALTFFINLSNTKNNPTYQMLIDWLEKNQLEVLFKADSNRISDGLRNTIFQAYFKRECLDKTHWITTNRIFDVTEIVSFANTPGNYEYLLKIVKDSNNHRRAIISAIDLLSGFYLPKKNVTELKIFLVEFLRDTKQDNAVKSQVIGLIEAQKFALEDSKYLETIFQIFKDEKNKQINRRLLALINVYEDIDSHFEYIKEEFLRDNKIVHRNDDDNVMRGNSYVLRELILKIKSTIKFLEIVKYYFNRDNSLRLNDDFANSIKKKLIEFIDDDNDFLLDFLKIVDDRFTFHRHEKFLKLLISESKTEELSIKFMLDEYPFKEVDYFIANIVGEETLYLVEKYIIGHPEIPTEKIEHFRNYIGHMNSRDLAINFQVRMEKQGYIFTEKARTQRELEKIWKETETKTQKGFDLLFERKSLLSAIENIFIRNENLLDYDKFQLINRKWYDDNGHGSIISPVLSLTEELIYTRRNETLDFEIAKKLLENDFVVFRKIENVLSNNKNSNWAFDVSKNQISKINEWCQKTSYEIDFDNVIILTDSRSFSYGTDYEKLKTILFYFKKFKLDLPKEFLLKCLKFYELDSTGDSDENFENFKEQIGDAHAFDFQVIENIKADNMFSFVLYKHINYAINNEIVEVFPNLIEYFKREISIFNEANKIERFVEIYAKNYSTREAHEVLISLSENIDSRICWTAIKILTQDKIEKEYCISKSIVYLNSGMESYLPEALEVLFIYNHEDAIDYLVNFIETQPSSSIRFISFGNYSKIKDYQLLKKLYAICYGFDKEEYESHLLRNFLSNYISNLSKDDVGYVKTQIELKKIRETLTNDKVDLFYINLLLEDSTKSYVNFKSKPFSFTEAVQKVDEILSQ